MENSRDDLVEMFTNTNTKWCLIPPAKPHMGGSWETLVRSIKAASIAMYTKRNPDEETFAALIIEVEDVVNFHPLTFVPVDPGQQEAVNAKTFF